MCWSCPTSRAQAVTTPAVASIPSSSTATMVGCSTAPRVGSNRSTQRRSPARKTDRQALTKAATVTGGRSRRVRAAQKCRYRAGFPGDNFRDGGRRRNEARHDGQDDDPALVELRGADADYHRLCIDIQEPCVATSELLLEELEQVVARLAAAIKVLASRLRKRPDVPVPVDRRWSGDAPCTLTRRPSSRSLRPRDSDVPAR